MSIVVGSCSNVYSRQEDRNTLELWELWCWIWMLVLFASDVVLLASYLHLNRHMHSCCDIEIAIVGALSFLCLQYAV